MPTKVLKSVASPANMARHSGTERDLNLSGVTIPMLSLRLLWAAIQTTDRFIGPNRVKRKESVQGRFVTAAVRRRVVVDEP